MISPDSRGHFAESVVPYSDELSIRSRQAFMTRVTDPQEVFMSGWKESGDSLFTTALSACIAMAAYNSNTRRGVLGHFSVISPAELYPPGTDSDREKFRDALEAVALLGPIACSKVWLGGGNKYIGGPESDPGVLADRSSAVEGALNIGIHPSNICERWEEEATEFLDGIDVGLDCRSGVLTEIRHIPQTNTQYDLT
jgi:hypothetical protein